MRLLPFFPGTEKVENPVAAEGLFYYNSGDDIR